MWICSVCLSFHPSTVVRYYMKYKGLSLGPSPQFHGSWCVFVEERSVKWWVTFYLALHYNMPEAIFSHVELFIRATNDLVSYQEGGNVVARVCQPCCLIDLVPQFVVTGLQKTWTISLNLATKCI